MGKIPEQLRQTIAANIRACRVKKFPGRGGGKRCAEAFGVSPQQWSPWERGMRTPDELRLAQIADFFGVTVEDMRRDHSTPDASAESTQPNSESDASANEGVSNNRRIVTVALNHARQNSALPTARFTARRSPASR